MSNVLDFGVNGQLASKVGGTGTSIKYFPRLVGITGTLIGSAGLGGVSGSGVAGPLFNNAPSTPSTTSAVGSLFLPAANVYNAQQLNLIASGTTGADTGDPSANVTISVQAVTGSLTAPVYTTIASAGGGTLGFPQGLEPWTFDIILIGDSGSGLLTGFYSSILGATVKTPALLDNLVFGLNFASGNPALQQGAVLGFVVGVTFGTSDASNKASLTEFTIES
jgi:hypothetical protein